MNLTDLRAELDRQADRVDGTGGLPLPAIRRRAIGIRRRRILTTAFAVALVATGLPLAFDAASHRTQPPTVGTSVQPVPDVIQDGVRYRSTVDGDTLLETVIGEVGQNEITFTWTPPNAETEIRPFCIDPQHVRSEDDPLDAPYRAVVRSGSRVVRSTPCARDGGEDPGDSVNAQPIEPTFRQPQSGKPVRISIRLGDFSEAPRTNPQIRLGLGIYRVGPMRVVAEAGEGLRIPEILERDGRFYRLVDLRTNRVPGATVSAPVRSDTRLLLTYGMVQLSHRTPARAIPGPRTIRLTGIDPPVSESSDDSLPGVPQVPVAPRSADTATASYTGPPVTHGVLFLAVYTQV